MNLLIIRLSSIGDIVLTTPLLRCLRKKYPDANIHFLVKQNFRSAIEHNPYIDQIHILDTGRKALMQDLKKSDFDFIIDLQKNRRSRSIRTALRKPVFSFPKLNFLKWIYVNLKCNLMPDKSIVERYFKAVKPLKINNDGKGLDFFIPDHLRTAQDDIPMSHWAGYLACVIGGSFPTKRFPVEKWKDFCVQCPFPVILLGGPEDRDNGTQIAGVDPGKIYNACGKFSLLESADLVRRAKAVISNDTGLMHIAAAFQKPVISLWGNTTPDMGMFPYYGQNNVHSHPSPLSLIMEIKHLSCRPCSKLGFQRCPKGHFKCMNEIPLEPVLHQARELWKN